MSICTFGLYEIYWIFKNWKAIKAIEQSDIWPIARTFFLIFTSPTLFRKMYEKAKSKGFAEILSTDYLAAIYIGAQIAGNLSARLDNQVGAILFFSSFLSIYPLVQMQNVIGFYNRQANVNWEPLPTYSVFEKLLVVVGGILTILALISLVPQALGFSIV